MRTPPTVAIIGAGFGGLGMAMSLRRAGFTDLTVYEQAADLGGVWRENTYPGAACDIPSALYSYSFAPNPRWRRRYAEQPDILDYLRRTATEAGVLEHVRFGTEVRGAEFDEATRRWRLHLAGGAVAEADVLIPAVGQLSRPAVPELPGAADFRGPAFHSAHWRHDVDLTGKRIAVIGTGASAIQFVPRIQPAAGQLTVFQRSAPYVVPKPDRGFRPWHGRLFRALPSVQRACRFGLWVLSELINLSLTALPPLRLPLRAAFTAQLRRQVRDPRLRAALRPDTPLGCKRLLFSNDWYPALAATNTDVVTAPIDRITATGVRTTDGVEHPADVLIYGTGFRATEFLAPMSIRGAGGRELAEVWRDGARAHLGMTVPGFPNMFIVYGPNTNLGGSSIIYMIEQQCAYVTRLLRRMVADGLSTVEIKAAAAERYDAEMQRRLVDSVWAGCVNWYRGRGGRISTNWPGTVWEYHRRTARAGLDDFDVAS